MLSCYPPSFLLPHAKVLLHCLKWSWQNKWKKYLKTLEKQNDPSPKISHATLMMVITGRQKTQHDILGISYSFPRLDIQYLPSFGLVCRFWGHKASSKFWCLDVFLKHIIFLKAQIPTNKNTISPWNSKQTALNGCLVKQPFFLQNHPIDTSIKNWSFWSSWSKKKLSLNKLFPWKKPKGFVSFS